MIQEIGKLYFDSLKYPMNFVSFVFPGIRKTTKCPCCLPPGTVETLTYFS